MKVVAEGTSLAELITAEKLFAEGESGEMRLYIDRMLPEYQLAEIEREITSRGVVLTAPIAQEGSILSVKFQKAIAPLLIIAAAVAAFAALIGWQIFKEHWGIPWWIWLAGGGAVLYLMFREPARQIAPAAIQASKVYITRRALKNPFLLKYTSEKLAKAKQEEMRTKGYKVTRIQKRGSKYIFSIDTKRA